MPHNNSFHVPLLDPNTPGTGDPDALRRIRQRQRIRDRRRDIEGRGPPAPVTPTLPTFGGTPSTGVPAIPSPQPGPAVGAATPALPEPTAPTVSDVLRNLILPRQGALPPYLRDFGRFIEDLLVQQSQVAIPVPKIEGGRLVTTGSQVETLEVPQDVEAFTAMWQTFLDMVQSAPLALQQQLVGLRFTPQTGFFQGGQAPILPNPEFL